MPRTSGHSNECAPDEVEDLYGQLVTHTRYGKKRIAAEPTNSTQSSTKTRRSYSTEFRMWCAQQYGKFLQLKLPSKFNPSAGIQKMYNLKSGFVKASFQRFVQNGTCADQRSNNKRPLKYGGAEELKVQEAVRTARSNRRTAPARKIAAELRSAVLATHDVCTPRRTWIQDTKKKLGYTIHKCKKKPLLSREARKDRLDFAIEHCDGHLKRTVVYDEKWFFEPKGCLNQYEARRESPVQPGEHFYSRAAETDTQLNKVMFIAAVSENRKIGLWEIDFKHSDNVTKEGKPGKGLTSRLLVYYLKLLHQAARTALGPGPIRLWCDRAPSHTGAVEEMQQIFDEVVMQAARSPDTNCCDAAIFPYMDRLQQQECGSGQLDEIRRSTRAAWDKLTESSLLRIANRVRRNMKKIIAMKGGNWYTESSSRKIEIEVDAACEICEATYTADRGKDQMMFCETCNYAAHVGCVGLARAPRGDWLCETCS